MSDLVKNPKEGTVLRNFETELGSEQKAVCDKAMDEIRNGCIGRYSVYLKRAIPKRCPVCYKKLFSYDEEAIIVHGQNNFDYSLPGRYCEEHKLIYLREKDLVDCLENVIELKDFSWVELGGTLAAEDEAEKKLARDLSDGKTLYIHGGNIICEREAHRIVCVTALFPMINSNDMIKININHCRDCDRCFIHKVEYETYAAKKKLPAVRFADVKDDGCYPNEYGRGELATESALKRLGYNVGKADDFSDAYRQALLGRILDCKVMKKHEITRHLDWLISSRNKRDNYAIALAKWRKDLEFVQEYKIKQQEEVHIIDVNRYYRKLV